VVLNLGILSATSLAETNTLVGNGFSDESHQLDEIAINAEFLNYRFAFGNFNMLPLKT